jgi:uncharacterized protein (AIM24 family)
MPESPQPFSTRDVAGEDFLFHLYRGSEMLQDNRVHDAKAELEQALNLQPSDPKGQDLLAIVYFRLGLYPRAITIYERLIATHPEAVTPRVNLALCYLKTGLAAQARAELERVLEVDSSHSRAWGYLGLAFQRLGDFERASHAFAAGGHDAMARRLLEMSSPARALSLCPPSLPHPTAADPLRESEPARSVLEPEELEAGLREPLIPRPPPRPSWVEPVQAEEAPPPMTRDLPGPTAPRGVGELARDWLIVFPRDRSVALTDAGLILVQAAESFAVRLEFVKSMIYAAEPIAKPLSRRMRGRVLDEPLGGAASPIVELSGRGELVLGPHAGRRLLPMVLDDEPLYLREDLVCGFEATVGFESGRLAIGDGDAMTMVQLRGLGAVIVTLPEPTRTIEIVEGRSTTVRASAVLGWMGRLAHRVLGPAEAPARARGYLSFAGEGMVLVDAR